MARMLCLGWLAAVCGVAGCASGPGLVRTVGPDLENPMFIPPPQTADAYKAVFDRIYDVVHQEFEMSSSNRFAGRIETHWLVTAGYVDLPRFWLYSPYENKEATLQSIRRRCEIEIAEAELGGYTVRVRVFKELEDLPFPAHESAGGGAGAAIFRYETPFERQFEVVGEAAPSRGWIPYGRDYSFEQALLARIRQAL